MPDSTVSVSLIANVQGFVAGMRTAQAATGQFAASLEKSAAKRQALSQLGNAAGVMGAVGAAAFVGIVKAAADFDQKMSGVGAVLDKTGLSTTQVSSTMDSLRQAALDAGAATQYSAGDAADAVTELTKAGVSATDILAGGLRGSLDLAAAGELAVGDAAEIAATTMNQFGLAGADIPHIADEMAGAANVAQGEVTDMAEAMKYVGPVASQMGVSLDETVGAVTELATKGIMGSQAGESLRGMLLSLTSPSSVARAEMDKLGMSVYDTQGNFVGFNGVAEQMHSTMGKLTNAERDEAFGRIFGNAQVTTARILYEGGGKAVDSYTQKVERSASAHMIAAAKMDNLNGDIEQLRGSLSTLFIGMGEGAQSPLRALVQDITSITNALGNLPGPVKTAATALLGLTGLIGGGLFVGSKVIGGIATMRTNFATLGSAAKKSGDEVGGAGQTMSKGMMAARGGALIMGAAIATLASQMDGASTEVKTGMGVISGALMGFAITGGPWGAVIGGGVGLLQAWMGAQSNAAAETDAFTATLNTQTGALTQTSSAWAANKLSDGGLLDDVHNLGLGVGDVTQAMLKNPAALAKVNAELSKYQENIGQSTSGNSDLTGAQIEAIESAKRLRDIIASSNKTVTSGQAAWQATTEAARAAAKAAGEGGSANQAGAGAASNIATALQNEAKAAMAVTQAQHAMADATLNAIGGWIGFRDTVRQAIAATKGVGKVDIFSQTAQGDKFKGMLIGVASSWNNMTAAAQNAPGAYQKARASFVQTARAIGVPEAAIRRLAKAWLDKPPPWKLKATADTHGAVFNIKKVAADYKALPRKVQTHLDLTGYPQTISDVRKLQRRYNLTPKQVKTILDARDQASHPLAQVIRALGRYGRLHPYAHLGADVKGAAGAVRQATSWIDKLDNKVAVSHLMAEGAGVNAATTTANRQIDGTGKRKVTAHIDADPSGALKGAATATTAIMTAGRLHVEAKIDANPGGAVGGAATARGAVASVTGKTVYIDVVTRRHGSANADGGYISGPGGPRDDLIPAWLSNGEFVMNAAATARNLPELTAMNAQKFADGGHAKERAKAHRAAVHDLDKHLKHYNVTGKDDASTTKSEFRDLLELIKKAFGKDSAVVKHLQAMGARLTTVAKLQDKRTRQLDKATETLKGLRADSKAYAKSVAEALTHDAFSGDAASSMLQLRADINDARHVRRDLAEARDKGLSGALLRQLAASGNVALIDQVAHMSRKEIAQYEKLLKQRTHETRRVGDQTAHALYGKDIRHQTKVTHHLDRSINKLDRRLEHLERDVERGARRGTTDGNAHRHHRHQSHRKNHN
jgi:TP901 family phage tail tape measure protein